MARYYAIEVEVDGLQTIQLFDADTRSEAAIVTSVGNNLYRYVVGNDPVVVSPPELSLFKSEPFAPFQYGTPILFPPNRVKNATFEFQGKTYQFPQNEPPHHLHGELCLLPWKVYEFHASDEDGAFVTSTFEIADHPHLAAYFPHPLRVMITHRLKDGKLSMSGFIENKGSDEAPFAFGLHPYFAVPFDEEQVALSVPAIQEWPVTNQAFVTGEPGETAFSRALADGADISDYPALGCSLLSLHEAELSHCKIALKNRGITIHYQVDRTFPYVVLFRPDWAQSFSIEPYSCVTDAFNLPYDAEQTGAKGIQPGEKISFQTQLWIEKE